MDKYTSYCSEEQTRKALKLGAPILNRKNAITRDEIPHFTEGEFPKDWTLFFIPTAEQMIGWLEDGLLEEVHIEQDIYGMWIYVIYGNGNDLSGISNLYTSRQEATLAAIDAALEYLENIKTTKL